MEVEGDGLTCAQLDIQHGELEIPPGALLSHSNLRSLTVTRSAAALNVTYGMILSVVSKENTTTTAKAPTTSNAFCHQLSRLTQRSRSPRRGVVQRRVRVGLRVVVLVLVHARKPTAGRP